MPKLLLSRDSMIDEQIRDGDFVVVEDRKTADNGEMVIALLGGEKEERAGLDALLQAAEAIRRGA